MNSLFSGVKTTLISSLFVSFLFIAVSYTQGFWQPWREFIPLIFQLLTLVLIVFSAQFNQNRFALLAVVLLSVQLAEQATLSYLLPWQQDSTWRLLALSAFLAYLTCIKDRSLLSIHLIYRLVGISLVLLLSYAWLQLSVWLASHYSQYRFLSSIWFVLYLPLTLATLIIFFKSLTSTLLVQSAIWVSALVLFAHHFQLITYSWPVILLLLTFYYLLSVIASSYFLAYRDELTGLPSRRALFQSALSLGRKYSVAMMDIDHFKKFNDTYGHDVGDQVLKLVAAKLSKVKGGGKVFRYGGEEFTVIFPRKAAAQTIAELEKLRESIADYQMVIRQPERKNTSKDSRKNTKGKNGNTSVSVTISIGVATRAKKQNFEQVMKQADVKLYQAKKNGRNNVCG
ncbi:MAG: diguanylate cyclase [Thalassotalea sp.]